MFYFSRSSGRSLVPSAFPRGFVLPGFADFDGFQRKEKKKHKHFAKRYILSGPFFYQSLHFLFLFFLSFRLPSFSFRLFLPASTPAINHHTS